MTFSANPLSIHKQASKLDVDIQEGISSLQQKPNVRVVKQKWGKPYNKQFLIIEWNTTSSPGYFDYIAIFNQIPTSPFDYLSHHYYWINMAGKNTIVTDVIYKPNSHYYIIYYTYQHKRDSNQSNNYHFIPMETIYIYNNITSLAPMDDDFGFATQPHPRVSPHHVNIQLSKEATSNSQNNQNYTRHYPFLTASGQHTLDFVVDLTLTFNLNWYNPQHVGKWDYVAIYDHDPKNVRGYIANQWCWATNYKSGFCNTAVQFTRQHPKYIAYIIYNFQSKKYVIKEVMKYPNHTHWMSDLKNSIEKIKLRDLIIPGTHDSACYDMKFPLAISWTQTQSETFQNQLLDGIRYFDLRTEYVKGSQDKFHFVHNTWLTTMTVSQFLQLVKIFVSSYQEVIILDFNHFYSFNATIHDELIALIVKSMGNDMAPITFTQNVTIGKMWNQKKHVIVAYTGKAKSLKNRNNIKLWPTIRSIWPDVDKVSDAKKKLDNEVNHHHDALWVVQGILTPLSESSLPYSVQHLANSINPKLNTWLQYDWLHKSINIVISDFYLGNNVVSIAVQRNRALGSAHNKTIV